jgi:hypothetical protein
MGPASLTAPVQREAGRLGTMLAVGVILLVVAVIAAGSVLAVRCCVRALRRRREQRAWDDLVARHCELDRELTRIWQCP